MTNPPRRIAITPIYNEEKVIADVIRRISDEVDLVIAVNDGSTDATSRILAEWSNNSEKAVVVGSRRNHGASTALRKGYALVSHMTERRLLDPDDLIVEIDSDGQHDPKYIGILCDRFQSQGESVDVVLARRNFRLYPFYKVAGNLFLTMSASLLGGAPYKDVESNFRVMRARSFTELLKWYGGYRYSGAFEVGIILSGLGFRTDNDAEIDVPLYRAGAGFMDGFHVLAMGIRARYRLMKGMHNTDTAAFLEETIEETRWPTWYSGGSVPRGSRCFSAAHVRP